MDALVVGLRWLQLAACLMLLGGLGLLLAGRDMQPALRRWRAGLLATAPWLAAAALVANLGLLAAQLVSVTGRTEAALQWSEWLRLLQSTRFGAVWQWRQVGLLLLLGLLLWRPWHLRQSLGGRDACAARAGSAPRDAHPPAPEAPGLPRLATQFVLALFVSAAGVFSGHAAATEPAWLAQGAQLLHAVAAGLWAGALPALAYGLWLAARGGRNAEEGAAATAQTAGTFAVDSAAHPDAQPAVQPASHPTVDPTVHPTRLRRHVSHSAALDPAPSCTVSSRDGCLALLGRFSRLALASVLVLVATGVVTVYLQFGAPLEWPARADEWLAGLTTILERLTAALLGSAYGLQVLAKTLLLLPVLLIAARIRWVWMPQLARAEGAPSWPSPSPSPSPSASASASSSASTLWRRAAAWASAEAGLALLILLLAARLTVTLPAAHEQLVWPLPVRWSLSATWDQPGVAIACGLAAGLGLLGLGLLALLGAGFSRSRASAAGLPGEGVARQTAGFDAGGGDRPRLRALGLGAMLSLSAAVIVAASALSVEAYPDTYRRSDSSYTAVSVAQGAALFQQHCTGCHGRAGRGDGPQAAGLPRPAANLTEPHTALHTAGDIFWWLSHGRPSGGMPGFAEVMSVEQRWDVVNFLRAFSAGHQARILGPAVAPGQPWLGPPDFDFEAPGGGSASLKDWRERSNVLLVFFSPGVSDARLAQLAGAQARLQALRTELLAVPLEAPSPGTLPLLERPRPGSSSSSPTQEGARAAARPLPLVNDGSPDIAQAFLLFRRTLSDPGQTVLGEAPPHMEFLIDRYGYLRARWLPSAAGQGRADGAEAAWRGGWGDIDELARQAERLNREPRIRPPPDDHVH